MRILLIRPRVRTRYPRTLGRFFRIYEAGPLMIAGALARCASVTYVDENREDLAGIGTYDMVFMTVQTHLAPRAYELADEARRIGCPVILGGPHVSLCKEEALSHADAVVIGPGENVVEQVVRDMESGRLRRVYDGSKYHFNLGAPDYSFAGRRALIEIAPVVMSRGCKHRCSHCAIAALNKGRVSVRKPSDVIGDIDRLGSNWIYFVDDNLLSQRELVLEVVIGLAKRSKRIRWAGQVTADIVNDEELMYWFRESGCRLLFIGFDSIQTHSLEQIGGFKASRRETLDETVDLLHQYNISAMGSFMFGLDGDRPGDIMATVDAAVAAGLDAMALNAFTPIPGTPLYWRYLSQGRIFERSLGRYDFKNVVFFPMNFSPKELVEEIDAGIHRFYGLRGLLRRIKKMRNKSVTLPLNLAYNPNLSVSLGVRWRQRGPSAPDARTWKDILSVRKESTDGARRACQTQQTVADTSVDLRFWPGAQQDHSFSASGLTYSNGR